MNVIQDLEGVSQNAPVSPKAPALAVTACARRGGRQRASLCAQHACRQRGGGRTRQTFHVVESLRVPPRRSGCQRLLPGSNETSMARAQTHWSSRRTLVAYRDRQLRLLIKRSLRENLTYHIDSESLSSEVVASCTNFKLDTVLTLIVIVDIPSLTF
jgi:hypothetical protein